MKHRLFLFDLDDTLLDFRASERLAFARTLGELGLRGEGDPLRAPPSGAPSDLPFDALFARYQEINLALWRGLEAGTVSKDFLKVERFRKTFAAHGLDLDPDAASRLYLESLSDNVVLVDGAVRLCETLAAIGEVGIITNGIQQIQARRIASSGLGDHVSFVATSEACGHAKPDSRFFAYTAAMARAFVRHETIIVGDRLDADILGANRFGIESCWFNPGRLPNASNAVPTCEVASLHEIVPALKSLAAA
jgi:2-haloacid dehalogenase